MQMHTMDPSVLRREARRLRKLSKTLPNQTRSAFCATARALETAAAGA